MMIEVAESKKSKKNIPNKKIIPILKKFKELFEPTPWTYLDDFPIKVYYEIIWSGVTENCFVKVTRTQILNENLKKLKFAGVINICNLAMGDYLETIDSVKASMCQFSAKIKEFISNIEKLSKQYDIPVLVVLHNLKNNKGTIC